MSSCAHACFVVVYCEDPQLHGELSLNLAGLSPRCSILHPSNWSSNWSSSMVISVCGVDGLVGFS